MRDHPQIAKITGKISLDHVPVNFYKTGFIAESKEYMEAEDAFRRHPVVREIVREQGRPAARGAIDPAALQEYLLGRAADPPGIDPRPGRAASKITLGSLEPFEFDSGGRSVAIGYSDAGGDLYTLAARGSRLEVTINRGSPLFAMAKNPLYLVALAVTEARAMAAGGGAAQALLETLP